MNDARKVAEYPDLIERLRDRQEWEKVGHNHDLLKDSADAIEHLIRLFDGEAV